jgi:hypothetical protein
MSLLDRHATNLPLFTIHPPGFAFTAAVE